MSKFKLFRFFFGLFIILGLIIGSLMMYVSDFFITFFFLNIFLFSYLLNGLTCDFCDQKIGWKTGASISEIISVFKNKKCRHCGESLDN